MLRNLTLEYFTGSMSWSRLEEEAPTPKLEEYMLVLRALRKRMEEESEFPKGKDAAALGENLRLLLDLAVEDALHPGKHVSFLEAMGIRSCERVAEERRTA